MVDDNTNHYHLSVIVREVIEYKETIKVPTSLYQLRCPEINKITGDKCMKNCILEKSLDIKNG